MRYGFVKAVAASPVISVADCYGNAQNIIEIVSANKEAELILLPELCLTSCSCGDLFTQPHFIQACNRAIAQIAESTADSDAILVFGAPVENLNSLYNCSIVVHKGEIIGIVPKHCPDSLNGENRWFTSAERIPDGSCANIAGKQAPFIKKGVFRTPTYTFGIEIGCDATMPDAPGARLAAAGAQIILNPSTGQAVAGTHKALKNRITEQSARYCCGYIYASNGWGESTGIGIYPGYCAIAECGEMIVESSRFKTTAQCITTETDCEKATGLRKGNNSFAQPVAVKDVYIPQVVSQSITLTRHFPAQPFVPQGYTLEEYCNEVFEIQATALAKRLVHTHAKSCVLGISGGLDSTLALLVTAKACDIIGLPHSSITAVTMPGFGTSGRTYNNAITLMQALGTTIREISIKDACIQHFKDIEHDIDIHDVTYENSQARERTQILMDLANRMNGIVVGTGDLSELALGWATYNGDHMSMYGVNASVPKTLMQHIVRWVAANCEDKTCKATLLDIVDTPISPELTPADDKGNIKQKTEDLVGPYELHDFFLYNFVRNGFSPEKIFFLAGKAFGNRYDKDTIKKWLKTFMWRFFTQQFKRSCMPDGPRVGSCNLSAKSWAMPSDVNPRMFSELCNRLETE